MQSGDEQRLVEIYESFYQKDFALDPNNLIDINVAQKSDGSIIGIGWLTNILEATVVLDLSSSPRDKFAALKAIIADGQEKSKLAGFDQMHVFPKDSRFTNILKKHLHFNSITGDCLIKNLK